MNSNYTQEEERSWYSTVDGSAIDIGLYQDNLSPTAPVEWEPEQQEFDKELFIEAVRAHACIWDVNSSSYKDSSAQAIIKTTLFYSQAGKWVWFHHVAL